MSLFKNIFNKGIKAESKERNKDVYFERHKQKIYPWIKVTLSDDDQELTDNVLEVTEEDSPIMKPWLGDLFITYVIDVGHSFEVIPKRDLPKSISEDQLHSIAIENLSRDIEFELLDTSFGGYMLTAGGNHEASSICLLGMWEWLADHLGDSLCVAFPAKDLVIIVRKSDSDKIDNLKIFVHNTFKDGERLLTRNIFEYDRDTTEWRLVDRVSENASR
jgi:uncharacterized protein YtpQ (UPF0354 family)